MPKQHVSNNWTRLFNPKLAIVMTLDLYEHVINAPLNDDYCLLLPESIIFPYKKVLLCNIKLCHSSLNYSFCFGSDYVQCGLF